jgi:hypothetical protein
LGGWWVGGLVGWLVWLGEGNTERFLNTKQTDFLFLCSERESEREREREREREKEKDSLQTQHGAL